MNDSFYENYERLDEFTPEGLAAYRQSLLDKTKHQVEFIRKHVPIDVGAVLELGTGNGRLLISLACDYDIYWGRGCDISKSRIAFADQWRRAEGFHDRLEFECVDIREKMRGYFDLSVCITGCFNYFIGGDPEKVLANMRLGRYALFELYKPPRNLKGWHKLPDTDRFMYLLDNYEQEYRIATITNGHLYALIQSWLYIPFGMRHP